jgi:hypothetical protein
MAHAAPPRRKAPRPAQPAADAAGKAAADRADAVARAKRAFTRGRSLYLERRYEDAMAAFLEAYRLTPAPGLLYNAALAAHKLNRLGRARELLRRYLALPVRDATNAAERQRARALLAEIEQQLPGNLLVESQPAGARVFVDSVGLGAAGQTPLRLPLRRGPHSIIVEREGFRTERREVVIRPHELTRLSLVLRPSAGRLSVSANVAGAVVLVDGRPVGRTPLQGLSLAPGEHRVEVRLAGYRAWRGVTRVGAGEGAALQAQLGSLRPFLFTALGVGVASVTAGIATGALARRAASDLEAAGGEFGGRNADLEARGRALNGATVGLLVVGGAALLGAGTLFFLERRAGAAERPRDPAAPATGRLRLVPELSPGRYGASARVRF